MRVVRSSSSLASTSRIAIIVDRNAVLICNTFFILLDCSVVAFSSPGMCVSSSCAPFDRLSSFLLKDVVLVSE